MVTNRIHCEIYVYVDNSQSYELNDYMFDEGLYCNSLEGQHYFGHLLT